MPSRMAIHQPMALPRSGSHLPDPMRLDDAVHVALLTSHVFISSPPPGTTVNGVNFERTFEAQSEVMMTEPEGFQGLQPRSGRLVPTAQP
jgi:hypothetical protein